MVHCVAYGCYNKTGKRKEGQRRVSFFNFPRDLALRREWIKRLRREGYQWKEGHKVCSDHFDRSQLVHDPEKKTVSGFPTAKNARLKRDAVPTFNYTTCAGRESGNREKCSCKKLKVS